MPGPRPPAVYAVRSRRRYWLDRGLASLAFAGACGFALRTASGWTSALGIAGLLLFTAMSVYAARQLLRAGPRLTLDADGFDPCEFRCGPIRWSQVMAVEPFGSAEAPFLALHVGDPEAVLARMPLRPRLLARLQRASGMPVLSISLIGVDRPLPELHAQVHRLHAQAQGR